MTGLSIILKAVSAIFCLMPAVQSLYGQTCSPRYAVTGFSVNFLREKPDFPEELGNQLLMGTPVEIIAEDGYWRQVVSPEPYTAWCVEMGLVEMSGDEIAEYIAAPKYIVTSDYGHVFSGPSEKSERLSDLVMGDLLRMALKPSRRAREGNMRPAGVSEGRFAKVILPSGTEGYVRKCCVEEFGAWAASRRATEENIVNTARLFLGVPYQWGGTSVKGVDCSGLTRMVWFMNGVLLPRNASRQAATGTVIPYPGRGSSVVDKEAMLAFVSGLRPGDLLFFGSGKSVSHVGIYTGEGRFVHASQKVRISSLIPEEEDFYELSWKLLHACRVIGQEDRGTGVTSMTESPAYFRQSVPGF